MKIWYDENLSQNKTIEKSVKNKFKNSLLELKLISFLLERKRIEAIKILMVVGATFRTNHYTQHLTMQITHNHFY